MLLERSWCSSSLVRISIWLKWWLMCSVDFLKIVADYEFFVNANIPVPPPDFIPKVKDVSQRLRYWVIFDVVLIGCVHSEQHQLAGHVIYEVVNILSHSLSSLRLKVSVCKLWFINFVRELEHSPRYSLNMNMMHDINILNKGRR